MPVNKKYFSANPFFLFLLIFLFLKINIQAQHFNSDEEIKKFADYLFCAKDYLRSIQEYRRLSGFGSDADLQLKIGVAFMKMEKYDSASSIFNRLSLSSENFFRDEVLLLKLKTDFLQKNFLSVDEFKSIIQSDSIYHSILKLKYFSKLIMQKQLPAPDIFSEDETASIGNFTAMRDNIIFKSPALAAFLSIIPGLGKIYTEEYGDGIYAFIFSGVFAFLAYDNFTAKHYARAWIFSTAALGYYGGNIYGAAASAQIYNARIKAEFDVEVDSYLKEKNYFVPKYLEHDCGD